MKKPTIKHIKEVMLYQGMKVFTNPYDMTKGAIRSADTTVNVFNDYLFMLYHDNSGNLHGKIIKGTTDSGLYYLNHPMHPKGTAIIQHGKQYIKALRYMPVGGHRGQEAFRQIRGMDYWRDANRDNYLDFNNPEYGKIYNTNEHDMGWRDEIGKYSAGCTGSHNTEMEKLYTLARLQIKNGYGDEFSYAVLHEDMFK